MAETNKIDREAPSLSRRLFQTVTLKGHRLATVVFIANVLLLIITVLAVSLTLLINSAAGRREQARFTAEQTAKLIAGQFADVGEISIANVARIADESLDGPMTAQAYAAAYMVSAAAAAGYDTLQVIDILTSIVNETVLDEFWITDTLAFSYLTNVRSTDGSLVPFAFDPDPAVQPQAYKFYSLLDVPVDSFAFVTQPAQVREIDPKVFKYVGTNGVDHQRIVQVGNELVFSNEELLSQTHATTRTDVSAVVEGNLAFNMRVIGVILDHFMTAAQDAGWSVAEVERQLNRIVAHTAIGEILISNRSGDISHVATSSGGERPSRLLYESELDELFSDHWVDHHSGDKVHRGDSSQYKYVTVARTESEYIVQVGLPLVTGGGSGNILYFVYQAESDVTVQYGYPEALWFIDDSLQQVLAAAEFEEGLDQSAGAWRTPYYERSDTVAGLYEVAMDSGVPQSIARLGLFEAASRGIWLAAPVFVEDVNRIGGLVLFINMDTIAEGIWSEIQQTGIVTFLLLIFTAIATFFGSRLLTQPIERIADAVRFVETGEQPDYDLIAPVAARADEIGSLARVFQEMSIQVFNREEVLEALVSERTAALQSTNQQLRQAQLAINQDLEMAKVVQAALVRDGTVDLHTFAACARMVPAQRVGGDFVDFQVSEDGEMFIVVGDVSGKGVASALFMAASQAAIKFAAAEHESVGAIAATANDRLCKQNPMGLFVTCVIARVDLNTGTVDYVSAGHEPPYLLAPDGTRSSVQGTNGIALGVLDELSYSSKTFIMKPGQTLFIYTDGLTDMLNLKGELFGKERLEQALDEVGARQPLEIVDHLWSDIGRFSEGTAAADDMTCLVLHRKNSEEYSHDIRQA